MEIALPTINFQWTYHILSYLYNEFSGALRDAITAEKLTFELVPPHQHRSNAAERAMRTFKNHFMAGLATCDPDFPLREWDRLLPQAELTFNLLQNSRVNTKLSAWAYLFGNHDFNKVPLLPPGTKVVMHAKPDKRKKLGLPWQKGVVCWPRSLSLSVFKSLYPKNTA